VGDVVGGAGEEGGEVDEQAEGDEGEGARRGGGEEGAVEGDGLRGGGGVAEGPGEVVRYFGGVLA
jgi:hypothetical protein